MSGWRCLLWVGREKDRENPKGDKFQFLFDRVIRVAGYPFALWILIRDMVEDPRRMQERTL